MGQHTDIHWCDSSVNPSSGCDGCELWIRGKVEHCYAGKIHERFGPSKAYPGPFEQVDLQPGRMAKAAKWPDLRGKSRPDKPWLNGLPRIIFVGDMSDLFSKDVSFEYIRDEVFANIMSDDGYRHIWMVLTKQPKRLAKFARWLVDDERIGWPRNVICGASITSNASWSRIGELMKVPGNLFLSIEPLLEAVRLHPVFDLPDEIVRPLSVPIDYIPINKPILVIVGGESGKDARPFDIAWARSLRDECARYKVDYFCKQIGSYPIENGKRIPGRDVKGGDWSEWPEDLRVRQFPRIEF